MKNIIVRTPLLLKGGFYLNPEGKIEYSTIAIPFAHFTYDKLPDCKDVIRDNRSMLRDKIKEVSKISPEVFSNYWYMEENKDRVKVTIYVRSESFDVNSFLAYIKALTLSAVDVE